MGFVDRRLIEEEQVPMKIVLAVDGSKALVDAMDAFCLS